MTFADTTELQLRWRTLTNEEQILADLYLNDATRDIRRAFPDIETRMASDTDLVLDVSRITCNLVRRRMVDEDGEDLDQITNGGRVYVDRTASGTDGLTAQELATLATGMSTSQYGSALPQWSNEP